MTDIGLNEARSSSSSSSSGGVAAPSRSWEQQRVADSGEGREGSVGGNYAINAYE